MFCRSVSLDEVVTATTDSREDVAAAATEEDEELTKEEMLEVEGLYENPKGALGEYVIPKPFSPAVIISIGVF